jgi:hypothetical protein
MAKKKTAESDATKASESSAPPARQRTPVKRASATPKPRAARSTATEEMHLAAADDAVSTESSGTSPTYEEIAETAYRKYLERGAGNGSEFDDWVAAERELRERRSR